MTEASEIGHLVLDHLSAGREWFPIGPEKHHKYSIGAHVVHVRFCRPDKSGSPRYKVNINPNTLTADYEVWICGYVDAFYVVPFELIHQIYNDPEAYPDRHHPRYRIVTVNVDTDIVTYAKAGKAIDLAPHWCRRLQEA